MSLNLRGLTTAVALITGLAFSLPSGAAQPAPGPAAKAVSAIPLGDFMGRLRSIEVVATGGQRGTFLLDTGSGVSFVTPEFAKRIGCESWGRITGFRLTGERLDLPRCDAVSMTLGGGKALAPLTIGVLDLKPLLPPGAPAADGSLALDALDGQVFTLDLRAGTLEFETPKSLAQRTAGAIEVPIRVSRNGTSGHGLGVSARMKTAKGDLWLEVDSGGGAPVLLRKEVAAEAGADPGQSQAQPYTLRLSGSKGGDVVLPTRAIVRDMIHDGVVGMPVLVNWKVTLDLAGDRMWVTPAKR
ncbi:MAG: aspartyl protease family protein [Proteobacteria bacterium]|nr:aspartyl protease family protein [Pseudomonadota bacterium]